MGLSALRTMLQDVQRDYDWAHGPVTVGPALLLEAHRWASTTRECARCGGETGIELVLAVSLSSWEGDATEGAAGRRGRSDPSWPWLEALLRAS